MSDTRHVVLIHGMWGHGKLLDDVRAAFEKRGYTVHTPTLRYHDLPIHDGAMKIATLSIRDYVEDLVALVRSLDTPPLLVGHSMGGLLAQLVAARTRHTGLVAMCPSPVAGIYATTLTNIRMVRPYFLRSRPWAEPVYPPSYERFRQWFAHTQPEDIARQIYDGLVCESGRAICDMFFSTMKLSTATVVGFAAVTTPVLIVGADRDPFSPPGVVRQTAARYQYATSVEIPRSDHMVLSGASLSITMGYIDDWLATTSYGPRLRTRVAHRSERCDPHDR
jgi:pimeloyl-ACP methyl ester carboxylesterase